MPLSLKQLQNYCLYHVDDSSKCRYLAQDDNDPNIWFCLKKSARKAETDDEIVEYVKEFKSKGLDPYKQDVPLGDNCSGYPILRYKIQGYDQK
jgi:hypothetical protein